MRRRKRLEAVQLISHCRRSCVTHLAAMDGLAQSGHPNRSRRRNVLLFVVARSRLDRYEELRPSLRTGVMSGSCSTAAKGNGGQRKERLFE